MLTIEQFKSKTGTAVREFCEWGTKEGCRRARGRQCGKVHFRRIVFPHTDTSLGDCSFLDTCRHMKTCKASTAPSLFVAFLDAKWFVRFLQYVHYELDEVAGDFAHSAPRADDILQRTANVRTACVVVSLREF